MVTSALSVVWIYVTQFTTAPEGPKSASGRSRRTYERSRNSHNTDIIARCPRGSSHTHELRSDFGCSETGMEGILVRVGPGDTGRNYELVNKSLYPCGESGIEL